MSFIVSTTISTDITIIGGGIGGLWLLNRLVNAGFNAILLEEDALGGKQTLASQGMVHGGIKYALAGSLSGESEAVAAMPDYWKRCLNGNGDVDLTQTKLLSPSFYMWSAGGLGSRLTSFFASKALRGRIESPAKSTLPAVFQHKNFKGKVYQLEDIVLDTQSLLRNLATPHQHRIFSINWQQATWLKDEGNARLAINAPEPFIIESQQFVFTAGEGNHELMQQLDLPKSPAMQCRPLQQVLVKHPNLVPLYGHWIGTGTTPTPRLTISTHYGNDNVPIWYLGGDLSSMGAERSAEEQIAAGKKELSALFPWVNLTDANWQTLWINRAEPKQSSLIKPDNAFAQNIPNSNVTVAWPTKLTLAPDLANRVMSLLTQQNIIPKYRNLPAPLSQLPQAPIAENYWDKLFRSLP